MVLHGNAADFQRLGVNKDAGPGSGTTFPSIATRLHGCRHDSWARSGVASHQGLRSLPDWGYRIAPRLRKLPVQREVLRMSR
jgi:hypothetical protein